MTDTDSKMMRAQQNKDVRQTIEPDETRPAPQTADSDPASGKDREAALAGEAELANNQMDAIFNENKGGEGALEANLFQDVATDGKMGLARKGRSLLGD